MTKEGIIKSVLFTSEDNFSIIKIVDDNGDTLVASGSIAYPSVGFKIKLTGNVSYNKKYNQNQMKVDSYVILDASQKEIAVAKFLIDNIHGIGEKTARRIVSEHVDDLEKLFSDPNNLAPYRIRGEKAEDAVEQFDSIKPIYELYLLTNGSITTNIANKIIKKYGDNAAKKIKQNPYIITCIPGYSFKTADKMAKAIGIKADAPERVSAGVAFVLSEAESSGHAFLTYDQICEKVEEILFTKTELREIYYDVILKTSVPDDTSEYDTLYLGSLSEIQLHNLYYEGVGETNLSDDEITCLNEFRNKRENVIKKMNEIIANDAIFANKASIQDIVNDEEKTFVIEEVDGLTAVYRKHTYITEHAVADRFVSLAMREPLYDISKARIDKIISDIEAEDTKADGVLRKFNTDQIKAVHTAINNRISIITGGPGRGKTTILRAVCESWPGRILLLAPTGKAAQKMSKDTGRPAQTIHRYIIQQSMSGHPVSAAGTLVVVDESSMVDLFLMNLLLQTLGTEEYHLVLVGDKDQLPSIGLGVVLEDGIKSSKIPCTYLTKCYRNDGSILHNIDCINAGGRLQDFIQDNHCRIGLNERNLKIESLVKCFLQGVKKFGLENTIILTPMNRNEKGVINLNNVIQNTINPKQVGKELQGGHYALREGDRVIQTKNDYDIEVQRADESKRGKGVFNGETGTITRLDAMAKKIEVTFDDGKIGYYGVRDGETEYLHLALAYAITIHKSQGSEYKCVILHLGTDAFVLLNRKLLYTGASRAKELLILTGNPKAYYMAIQNTTTKPRQTRLEYRLRYLYEEELKKIA